MSIFNSFWQYLSVARLPRVALSFNDNNVVMLDVRKKRGQLAVDHLGSALLPKTLLQPDFSNINISEPAALASILRQASERAGLRRESRWSIVLPEGVARSLIVSIDNKPETREELDNMVAWKVERQLSVEQSRLRIVRQSLGNDQIQPRFLVTVVAESVIKEYEAVFQLLGWHCGVIMPRHLSEALWLAQDGEGGEKLLVSYSYWGFVSVALRGDVPLMVRVHECGLEERENELYTMAVYYRDKIMHASESPVRVLALGEPHEVEMTQRTFADALSGINFYMINPAQLSLALPDAAIDFGQIAAPAALASLAYK